jgi:signal transduction histidine kinase
VIASAISVDPQLAQAYLRADAALRLHASKIGCILVLVMVPLGALLDLLIYPGQFTTLVWIRVIGTLVVAGLLLLHRFQFGREHIHSLNMTYILVTNATMSLMVMLTEGARSPYYTGLNLVLMGMSVAIPFSMKETAFACTSTLAIYIVACLVHDWHDLDLRLLSYSCFFIILTSVVCVTASYYASRRRFEDFRLRHQLDTKNRELADSYSKLSEMDRLRSHFFANISHELRTPLTLIIAPIEDLLRRGHGLSDSVAEALGIARQNALRLLKLINDLLELMHLEEKGFALRREALDLGTFATDVAESMRYLAEAKGLQLECDPPSTGLGVSADPSRIEKVVLNLLTNAIKFTPRGGRVRLCSRRDGERAVIEVSDSGIGIPEHELPNLFSRFHQVDGSSTRKYQGVGIGLALVKELIEEHGGTIETRSMVNRGTTMTVYLPLSSGPATARDASAPAPDQGDGSEGDALGEIYRSAERRGGLTLDEGTGVEEIEQGSGNQTVLVVDDEPDMRRYLVSRLVDEYHVLQSDHGERAVAVALARRPDLILLDLMLPGIDGIQVCRALRAHPELSRVKIILLTARMDEASKITALESGADDFLTKPFSTLEVKTRISSHLRTAALERAVQERASDLEKAIKKLKDTESQLVQSEKMSALGTIAAGLLHEVNNPLNFTLTALQVAYGCMDKGDLVLKEILDDIGQGMDRIKTIVSDLGMFAYKSPDGDTSLIDLTAVVDSAVRLTSHELGDITIERQIPTGTRVRGSKTQLSHVFMNLLVNSAKALKTVAGRQPLISISAHSVDGNVAIAVRDNGSGIPAENLPRIFEPFFTTRTVGQGTGLGLSICHTIIANANGTITARSEPGQWTEIDITLPCPAPLAALAAKEAIR